MAKKLGYIFKNAKKKWEECLEGLSTKHTVNMEELDAVWKLQNVEKVLSVTHEMQGR